MASEFLVLTDRGGRLSAVSNEAEATIGRSGGEIEAGSLFDLFAEESFETMAQALRSASPRAATALPPQKILTGTESEALFDISIEPAGVDKFWVRFTPVASEAEETGPLAKENFLDAVSSRLGLPGGAEMRLFMLDFGGLRDGRMSRELGEDAARNARAGIEAALSEAAWMSAAMACWARPDRTRRRWWRRSSRPRGGSAFRNRCWRRRRNRSRWTRWKPIPGNCAGCCPMSATSSSRPSGTARISAATG